MNHFSNISWYQFRFFKKLGEYFFKKMFRQCKASSIKCLTGIFRDEESFAAAGSTGPGHRVASEHGHLLRSQRAHGRVRESARVLVQASRKNSHYGEDWPASAEGAQWLDNPSNISLMFLNILNVPLIFLSRFCHLLLNPRFSLDLPSGALFDVHPHFRTFFPIKKNRLLSRNQSVAAHHDAVGPVGAGTT